MGDRLTKVQLSHLWRLAKGPSYHIGGKPEVRALERRGLVATNDYQCTTITPAGLTALEKPGE